MKIYSIDRQNYRIFKSEKSSDSPFVHFFWGKFDFRLSFEINPDSSTDTDKDSKLLFSGQGKQFQSGTLELLHHHKWYQYVKPTAHGLVLEETLWEKDGEKHYAEFPRDLYRVCRDFCAEELESKPLAPISATE